MARNLTSIPDIQAPDADYPVGRIQNEDAPIVGTPIIEELYGDIVQFFHKLMRIAGLTHNGLPENETQGFQFISALQYYVRTAFASTSERGVVELADNSETQAGVDSQRVVTPAGLESKTATTTRRGITYLATDAEIITGTEATKIATAASIHKKYASETQKGFVRKATNDNVINGTDNYMSVASEPMYVSPSALSNRLSDIVFRRIDIGDWNMDANASVTLAHGVSTFMNIRSVQVMIRNDNNNLLTPIDRDGYVGNIDSANIVIHRTTSGFFDSATFDATSFNRGFITIEYIV
jgi:hypothetical protein